MPLTLQAGESDFGWRSVPDVGVVEALSGELGAAGSFGDAGVGTESSGRVGGGRGSRRGRGGGWWRAGQGEKPACPVTWRRTMRRVRMKDMRSGSRRSGAVASYISARIA